MSNVTNKYEFYEKVVPVKLSEARKIKLHSMGWGLLTEYYLESVKINHRKGVITSVATLRICDLAGQITCIVKGPSVGLLFGVSEEEWRKIEQLCDPGQQLYYRYFKDGITTKLHYEQKLFYNFCASNQKNDVHAAIFLRCVNTRNNFKNDAFLDIVKLTKCDTVIMDMYTNYLRNNDSPK